MKSLLITGATGFVGRTLLLRAVGEGTHVLAPVRDPAKLRAQLEAENVPLELVAPLPADPRSWGDIRPERAALCAGVLFARSREEYFRTNVAWNLEVLRALPASCQTVVLSSQSAGGPTPAGSDVRSEDDLDSPITWYGESKLQLERAIKVEFPGRTLVILRPPMILGARDSATLPLFKMARGLVRPKPGLTPKFYSFLGVEDVVDAIFCAFSLEGTGLFFIGGDEPISDLQLIGSAARAAGGTGVTLPVPLAVVRILACIVDAVPALRRANPSLTRDRAREIWPDRWVVDASAFRAASRWRPHTPLDQALDDAFAWFRKERLI